MIVRDRPQGWSIDKTRFRGPSVMSCEVVDGKWTPLIGAYLPPSNMEDLLELAEALTHL